MKKTEQISIKKLYQDLLDDGRISHIYADYEVIDASDIQILTYGNKYVDLVWLSRHKTTKHLIKILIKSDNIIKEVIVTTDHVCMVYTRDHFFENINAENLKINQYVSIYDDKNDIELIGIISNIEDLGITDEYVYDCEVDNNMHAFYANDILIHNSQFIDLKNLTQYLKEKRNLPSKIREWKQKDKKLLWNLFSRFVKEEVNPFVRKLAHDYCQTTNQDVLTYELEYIADVGIYESKKHYAVHQIYKEGLKVDKTKYVGIELKKAQVPKEMKEFLSEIYNGVLTKDWEETDYKNYIENLYNRFKDFDIEEISFWKGYNTERQATGFLQMAIGTTGIGKAANFYNDLIGKNGLNIAHKYEEIRVGNKLRFCYLDPNNVYGINCIAYLPGQYPEEFREIFKPDYHKMFIKIILDALKNFRTACKFIEIDPSKQVIQDIFDL